MMNEYDRVIEELKGVRSESFKNFSEKIVNSSKPLLGVQVPRLREIAKRAAKENAEGYLACCRFEYFEDTMIYGLIIASLSYEELLHYLPVYLSHVDSWAHIDSFVASLKSVKKNRSEFLSLIKSGVQTAKDFVLRFCIVCLMTYYLDSENLDYAFDVCQRADGQGYYVDMAIAWLISVAYVKHKDKTLDFIKNSKLSSFTLNKSISKIKDSFRVSREDKILLQNFIRKN